MADTDNILGAMVAPAVPAAPAAPGAAPAAKSRMPLIAGAVAVLLLAGAGWYFGMHLPAQKRAEEESEKSVEKRLMKQLERKKDNKPPVFITMDEFLVNLPGKGGEHYLQTKIVLRTADNSTEMARQTSHSAEVAQSGLSKHQHVIIAGFGRFGQVEVLTDSFSDKFELM